MSVESLLTDLAACLCAELTPEDADGPDVCFCDVAPGQTFAHDYAWGCKGGRCGAAWVRLASAYPAEGLGVPADSRTSGCGTGLGVDIEMGVIRCLKTPKDGTPPKAADMSAAALRQIADMLAIRRTIKCCPALEDIEFLLGTYQPIGPGGLVIGGTWTLSAVFE
jgi:hypothetical protein